MKLKCESFDFDSDFSQVELSFNDSSYLDVSVFGQKNNKTVADTINHKRYEKFKEHIQTNYPESLEEPLGLFLLRLKNNGDDFYKCFLNKYGDKAYSIFFISNPAYFEMKGVYMYMSGNEVKYIGRCKDSMKKRINQGYGKIHPKNCYLDGQTTNCHINSMITEASNKVTLWLCEMQILSEIEIIEKELIRTYKPEWNIQRS
jgi:hypothetical protein